MNKKWLKYLNLLSLPIQMVVVMLGYFVIEAISRHSVGEAYVYMTERPLVFLYNSFLIFTTTLLVYLVRRRVFMRTLLAIFWLVLGIVNGVLLANRVTPFTGPDLHLLTDAFKIANKYLSPVFFVIVIVLAVAAVIGLVFLFLKGPKYQGKMTYKLNIPLVLAGVLAFAGTTKLALEKRVLSNYFGNIAFAYEDYGYPYCLATTIFNTGISCPRDYSEAAIKKIEKSESGLPETGEKRPNIIFLQLESFFDPTLVNFLNISEDPIPTFRKLMKEYSSGYYKVPSVGAGTANTEFESITGMSLRYFGPGEYPYKSILKETTCESAPYVLKNLGYSTHAIHNNEANFYGRKNVFANLGFDSFTSEEYMSEQDDTNPNDWMRDRNLTKYIMEALESSDDPDYIYTISVQGHGDYPEEPMIDDPKITVTGGESEAVNNKWEYYCNQIYEMDQFVKELTETLSKYDEDVVLVMYGDHLPTMGLKVKDVKNRYLFQTEYVIWDNMGLEKKDANVAAYQMAAEVMDRVGIHEGNILRFHQARRQTKNYQVDLETLQYDILYGKQYVYDGENPFARTEMHLGVKDAVLEKIEKISDGRYYITGENFTQSAYVEVNGELLDATYISPTTLLLTDVELKDGDEVDVAIRSNSSTRKVLTRTDSMIYKVPVEPLAPEVPPLEGENTEGTGEIDPNAAGIGDDAAANPIGEENGTGTGAGESPIEVPNTENPVQN
ncbi:LTA synthase family protein [Blautia producta]|uniref:Alkaline phosphatase family protein n=2 Tax=Blautia producta TaxID=33035 RepID=A0A7G5N0H5_9FIRM|nr:alkaline phosphatase family protein [Blautia producta]QIB56854.1 sulfatase-like hydrolase/transferase [Blautia producta ATCC 27340 = DSM 2950]QMW80368.1 alkaline phosphatase family protein [Blautia producta]